MASAGAESTPLAAEVAAIEWYHTLELAPGVVTPGWFDTRPVAGSLPWPDLRGKRCLDVGTFDGFWAFEMERRGASEVVAIDLVEPHSWDWPADATPDTIRELAKRKGRGDGFLIAREALGSKVERREVSIYDVDPDTLGSFDFVYLGSLLLHLRDPVRALGRARAVCTGSLMVVDVVDVGLSLILRTPVARLDGRGRPWWWRPNQAALVRMIEAAGFRVSARVQRIWMPAGRDQRAPRDPRLLRHRAGREALMRVVKGDPHAVVTAVPA